MVERRSGAIFVCKVPRIVVWLRLMHQFNRLVAYGWWPPAWKNQTQRPWRRSRGPSE